VFTIVPRCKL